MRPGYVDDGQFCRDESPIYIERVMPMKTGAKLLELAFVNGVYVERVKYFDMTLRSLKRAPEGQ
jgi:hypothetical protein